MGYLVETSKAAGAGTDTVLKSIRSTGNAVDIRIAGSGNEVRGANGVNVIYKNTAGERGKGNAGTGINVTGAGNGSGNPVEIELNTAKSNGGTGIRVAGTGHQLKGNASGGSGGFPGGDDNGKCELSVASGNFNATGNAANGVAVAGAAGSAFPTACQGTP